MKICGRCRETKSLAEFGVHTRKSDGLRAECRACTKEMNRQNYLRHLEERRADARRRRKEWFQIPGNAERNRLACAEWAAVPENAELLRVRSRAWNSANPIRKKDTYAKWSKQNQGLKNFLTKTYKLQKRRAVPGWANKFLIAEAYRLAALRSKMTGIVWHVDHLVPLRGRLVSGLHVQNNLAVIPARMNSVKSNKVWPDMPQ